MLPKYSRTVYIDPRIKLIHIIISIIMFVCARDLNSTMLLIASNCLLMLFFRLYKSVVGYALFGLATVIFNYLYNNIIFKVNIGSLYTVMFILLTMLPAFMTGCIFMKTTQITDMITAFRRIKLPYAFVITFAVTMRFIPTIKNEYRYIRNSMRIRGIRVSVFSFIRNPLKIIEYILIPLLFRSGKVADELSESALTRAIEYPCEKTSLNEITFRMKDYLYLTYIIAVFMGVLLWKWI